jgi:hypothetical protein
MTDLGNRGKTLRLQCKHCGWVPPEDMTMGHAQLHFQVDHDTDEVKFDLVPVCACGEAMEVAESRPWPTGGVKDYLKCGVCGNTGYLRRDAA